MYQLMYQFDSSGFAEDWMGKCIQILKLKWKMMNSLKQEMYIIIY